MPVLLSLKYSINDGQRPQGKPAGEGLGGIQADSLGLKSRASSWYFLG